MRQGVSCSVSLLSSMSTARAHFRHNWTRRQWFLNGSSTRRPNRRSSSSSREEVGWYSSNSRSTGHQHWGSSSGKLIGFTHKNWEWKLSHFVILSIKVFLQLISNDRFKSVEHRVVANREGPRVSVASFFGIGVYPTSQVYGPIKELLSEKNPAKYRETTLKDFYFYHNMRGLNGISALQHFRIGLEDERNG